MDKNLIECASCGYPLTKEERTGLTEINGKMHKPWAGLTDADIAHAMHGNVEGSNMLPYQFARAIEAKLKQQNAPGWQSVTNPTEYLDELRGGDAT